MAEMNGEIMVKVVELPAKDPVAADMDAMERDLPQLARYHRHRAWLKRQHFLACVEAGFDEEQALDLTSMEFAE